MSAIPVDRLRAQLWANAERRGPTECWPWRGRGWATGPGAISVDGRRWKASRVSLSLHTGEWPGRTRCACHTCDNPNCVNPAHLFWGSHTDNMRDASVKGRLSVPRPARAGKPAKARALRFPRRLAAALAAVPADGSVTITDVAERCEWFADHASRINGARDALRELERRGLLTSRRIRHGEVEFSRALSPPQIDGEGK